LPTLQKKSLGPEQVRADIGEIHPSPNPIALAFHFIFPRLGRQA
jgi:hypothetical protein